MLLSKENNADVNRIRLKLTAPHVFLKPVLSISGLIDYLREQTVEVMSLNRVQFCVGRLETARLAISGKTDVDHVQSLERRHGSAA